MFPVAGNDPASRFRTERGMPYVPSRVWCVFEHAPTQTHISLARLLKGRSRQSVPLETLEGFRTELVLVVRSSICFSHELVDGADVFSRLCKTRLVVFAIMSRI
jgi:hypothetical protein